MNHLEKILVEVYILIFCSIHQSVRESIGKFRTECWWRAQELGTFGFRGEALSSLCALAEVAVVTRTAEMAAGVRLAYDQAGAVLSQASAPRAVGTTVAVRDLFKPLPVRYKVPAAFCNAVPCLPAAHIMWRLRGRSVIGDMRVTGGPILTSRSIPIAERQ